VSSRDVKLQYLQQKYKRTGTEKARLAVVEELRERDFQDTFFTMLSLKTVGENLGYNSGEALASTMGSYDTIDFECLKTSIDTYEDSCSKLGEYGLQYVKVFVNLCNSGYGTEVPKLIPKVCEIAKRVSIVEWERRKEEYFKRDL